MLYSYFSLHLTLYKDENQLSTSLQHCSKPRCPRPSAKGHGHTRVNTTGSLSLAQVQLMTQSHHSTYLSLFLYLWGSLCCAPYLTHYRTGLLWTVRGQSAGEEALFGYDVLKNVYFWCSTWTITFHTDPRFQAMFCKFLFKMNLKIHL